MTQVAQIEAFNPAPLKADLKIFSDALEETLDLIFAVPAGPEKRVMEAMRYAVMGGGKRLRPFLVRETARLFDVPEHQALRVGAAIECVHCYSLIHDDLPAMDDDAIRRGKPTVHLAFDEATAILAGDALLTLAFEILGQADTHEDGSVRSDLVLALAKASGHQGMVGGQMIDLQAQDFHLDREAIYRLQHMKTGALILFSVEAGCILGRASPDIKHAVQEYARDLGLAFQIADDLLDVKGDPVLMGKAAGKDSEAGKATLVSLMGMDQARLQAEMLSKRAISFLDIFDHRADNLRAVAKFAISRSQ